MAATDFASNATVQKKVFTTYIWKQGRDMSFWGAPGMMSRSLQDGGKPVQLVNELTATSRGNKAVMQLIPDLTGGPVVGDDALRGNEEALTVDAIEIQVDQIAKAVRNKGRMSDQKTVIRFDVQARDVLANWLAQYMDELHFLTAAGLSYGNTLHRAVRPSTDQTANIAFAADVTGPTSGRQIFPGSVTATSGLSASDTLSWNLINKAKAFAKRKNIKPVMYKGKECYILVTSEEGGRDLAVDSDYITIVSRAGGGRGDNPLFKGYFSEVMGVIILCHNKVTTTLDATSGNKFGASGTVDGAQSLLIGAQCLGFARTAPPEWLTDNEDDYGRQTGRGYQTQIGLRKPVYTSIYDQNASEDFSIVSVYHAAAA